MPESSELDLDHVREQIHEEVEREGGRLLRLVALTTALLAAIAAIASLLAGSTVNEALALKTEATQLQARASDEWAYYQAKGIKSAVAVGTIGTYGALGRAVPDSIRAQPARYAAEQRAIADTARALERERDARGREADALLAKHHVYAYSVALLQVAIALGAVAALTRRSVAWVVSAVSGAAGIVLLVIAWLGR